MKTINLIHLGIGKVGKALVVQVQKQRENISRIYGVDLNYCGLFVSKGGIFSPKGLSSREISQFLKTPVPVQGGEINKVIEDIEQILSPFIVIDTTASDETAYFLLAALNRGGYVVISNKKPFTSTQHRFDLFHRLGRKRLFYETTVGAGLPVISTLKNFIETDDEIVEIKGCFSGTLGFLFSQLDKGVSFSEAVLKAKMLGFTEPDVRDDLSGLDVARKALILARLLGRKLELSDIELTSLYPKKMDKLTIDEFLDSLSQLDKFYLRRMEVAQKRNRTLRFVATVTPKNCTVSLEEVDKTSDLGGLSGPDNLILFRTKRYYTNPLIIKGPGAGAEVTASGVFGDILLVIKNLT